MNDILNIKNPHDKVKLRTGSANWYIVACSDIPVNYKHDVSWAGCTDDERGLAVFMLFCLLDWLTCVVSSQDVCPLKCIIIVSVIVHLWPPRLVTAHISILSSSPRTPHEKRISTHFGLFLKI